MRSAGDMPQRRRRPRRSTRSRVILLIIAAAIVVLLTSLRGIAGFYTDYLWFREVGYTPVWRGVLGAKILLSVFFTVLFFVLLWASLTIADRLAPRFRPLGSEDEIVQRYREAVGPHSGKLHAAVAVVFALIFGVGTSSQWQSWLLFRHSVSFGVKDPQFHKDIGFFVFRVPFLSFLVDWAFVALVIITFLTVIAHYLNGGIRLPQGPGERVTSQVKAHVSVLLAALALVKAAGYWLQRYQLATSRRGTVEGPTYTDIHAQLPAIRLLLFISLVAFVLLLVNIWRQGWVLPGIAVGLWLLLAVLVGGAYPAFIQKFRVQPSEVAKERPYISRNIASTRAAFGIDQVQDTEYPYSTDLSSADLGNDADTIRNVRLWDPDIVNATFRKVQEIRAYYQFTDVDVDRYKVNDKLTQVNVAARELNPSQLPSNSWINERLQFTHGYGAILSPTNAVTGDGLPDYLVKDVPPVGDPKLTQPRIYYGDGDASYAVVHSGQKELDFQSSTGRTESSSYSGKGGVALGSLVRRFAFFLRFSDYNLLISNQVTAQSKVMYIRNIRDRVRKVAPFLRYDADPYPVVLDGRVLWVQDGYTLTNRYPYSQQADNSELPDGSGLGVGFNYIRNSVKVTIDAYDGTMKFYVMDAKDPILKAYSRMFPGLFTPKSDMPAGLADHLRYPEDLFRVQTNMYGRYHITDPNDFYNKADAWNVAQNPSAGAVTPVSTPAAGQGATNLPPPQRKRMDPTYLLLHLPGDAQQSFLVLRPFVPVSQADKQQNLTAFMTAKSDPADYGKLQNFIMPRGAQIDGPALIDSRISSNEAISKEISLLGTGGSKVDQGNLLVIPIKTSLLYVRPLYVESDTNPLPELRKVIVVYANQAAMGDTLQDALTQLFGAAPQTLEQKNSTPSAQQPTVTPSTNATVAQLLQQAAQDFADADTALKNGDLAGYQSKVKDAQAKVDQARQQSNPQPTPTTQPSSA
ncbi:MAG: UPF0182 family protein [Actinobacteria bacterium]|nr:UPF0182 family protein [Actinomycetota bacterium]MBV9253980.1 UPF0182 family protein [Actinomycetota bacterium]